jgi:hypothetical protein
VLREVRICTASGLPASSACPSTRIEYLPADQPPNEGRRPLQDLGGSTGAESCPLHRSPSGGAIRPAELLQAGLLAGRDGAPRILFPLPEQLFYRDRTVEGTGQRLEAWIAAAPGRALSVRVTGSSSGKALAGVDPAEVTLSYPFRIALPLVPGTYRLRVSSATGSDSVRYHVR